MTWRDRDRKQRVTVTLAFGTTPELTAASVLHWKRTGGEHHAGEDGREPGARQADHDGETRTAGRPLPPA